MFTSNAHYKQFDMKIFISLLIIFVLSTHATPAQPIKREFRGVWVSTVANIDWPSRPGLSALDQQKEIIRILDNHKARGINAIILQIRPASDAIYPSTLEPWSRYLTGIQGHAPRPFYDPLKFWITEAHKRGMELHAWFNPYRIKQSLKDSLDQEHIFVKKPYLGWEYGNRIYFEPGHPEVWEFLVKVVKDVVSRYDVDAIHFDDYFYPYKIRDTEIPDDKAFEMFGGDFYPENWDAWRRHNVDTIIQLLSDAIKDTKPWVKFGISPFGVWRNRTSDPLGSETRAGTTNYDALYADIIKWQQKGWIDYIIPQLYWRDDHPVADFSTLAYWWNDFSYGRGMYIGLAPYRIDKKSDHRLWRNHKFFLRQIALLRDLESIEGMAFFSSKHFFREDLQRMDKKLRKEYFTNPAIVPAMPWINNQPPPAPDQLQINNNTLTWNIPATKGEMNKPRFYVIYYYPDPPARPLKYPQTILTITGESQVTFKENLPTGMYRVSSLDRLNNESQLSNPLIVE